LVKGPGPIGHFVPAGGTSPLGILGHVAGALELARQVDEGLLPPPARVVLPLGSGGTTAGLVLGLAIAGIDAEVVGVQVVPRV
ncbi:pyridoxal-phosphate dependent enzyme, partial [Staphylococcus aureus]|uniref:pyridoxal-phosphate dependent enzyme n=1 Tax=Staphylococcus aureus TaxID=1280 RepID=UPI001CF50257